MTALDIIAAIGVLPVIKITDVQDAVPLAKALRDGGIHAIEVTARSDAAFDSIRAIRNAFPDMTVGAGTILTTELADKAIEAGAEYCVGPGFNPKVVLHCLEKDIPFLPGCTTASEIGAAQDLGLRFVKFFPAEANGGTAALRDLSGPFPHIRFVTTGGMSFDNIENYLRMKCVAACGGSFMAKADVIKSRNWEKITADCRKALDLSLGFRLAHVGINHGSAEEASRDARLFCHLFRLQEDVRGEKCTFSGSYIENMNFPFYGTNGHICFQSNNINRAFHYFRSLGVEINEDSIQRNSSGEMICFYLTEEIGGFAVHVI